MISLKNNEDKMKKMKNSDWQNTTKILSEF